MSTFDGRIREYPAIAVDNFQPTRPGVRIFLLSHVHADHLSGLDSRSFNIPLYCSEDTAKLLPAVRAEVSEPGTKKRSPAGKYTHLKPFLKPLEYQEPTQICIGAETITLTLFTANHCPGSTMFLIEGSKGNVVYTGDMRAEDWFLDTLESHMSSFSNILHVYLDTTFCHESFADFPSKSRSIEAFMEVIRQYDAETCFVIGYNILGVEPIWDRIYEDYGEKVFLSPKKYALYSALDTLDFITDDPDSTRFHACDKTCSKCNALKRTSNPPIYIHPSSGGWQGLLCDARRGFRELNSLARRTGRYSWGILFAMHSSLTELQALVSLLRPSIMTPCVLNRKDRNDSKRVKDLFKPFLNDSPLDVIPTVCRTNSSLSVKEEGNLSSQGTEIIEEVEDRKQKPEKVDGQLMKNEDTVADFAPAGIASPPVFPDPPFVETPFTERPRSASPPPSSPLRKQAPDSNIPSQGPRLNTSTTESTTETAHDSGSDEGAAPLERTMSQSSSTTHVLEVSTCLSESKDSTPFALLHGRSTSLQVTSESRRTLQMETDRVCLSLTDASSSRVVYPIDVDALDLTVISSSFSSTESPSLPSITTTSTTVPMKTKCRLERASTWIPARRKRSQDGYSHKRQRRQEDQDGAVHGIQKRPTLVKAVSLPVDGPNGGGSGGRGLRTKVRRGGKLAAVCEVIDLTSAD